MKKILSLCSTYLEPMIMISALVIAMVGQSQLNMFLLWISFSLLIGISFWRLRKPETYNYLLKDKVFLSYSLFILWAILSCLFWTQVGINSILILLMFLAGLCAYFIGYTGTLLSTQNTDKLLLLLGLGLVFLSYYQFFELAMPRPIGLLLNWNTHAGFLAMIILPWMLRYALTPVVKALPLGLLGSAILLFSFALGLTQSRGAFLIVLVAIFCVAIYTWRQRLCLSYKRCLVLLGGLFMGYLYSGLFVSTSLFQRLATVADIQNFSSTASGRHLLWRPAWQMYLDQPFTGWGLDAYSSLFAQYKAPLTDEIGSYAHNDFLQILMELGPIGLLLFLSFVIFIIQKFYYLLQKQTGVLSYQHTEALVLIVSCIGMLAHTFFTFHLYHASMLILLSYYLGRAAKNVQITQGYLADNHRVLLSRRWLGLYRVFSVLIILVVAIYAYASYQIIKAEKTTSLLDKADYYHRAGIFITALDKADAVGAHYYMLLLKQKKNPTERKKIATHALGIVNSAIEKMPLFKWNYISKGKILMALQKTSEARKQYAHVLKLDPYLLQYRYEYAMLLSANGQHQHALKILWAAWGLLYHLSYQDGISYLYYQRKMVFNYGNKESIPLIEQQIKQLLQHKRYRANGHYVFKK